MGNCFAPPPHSPCCPRGAYGPCVNVASKGLKGKYEEMGPSMMGYAVGEGTTAIILCCDLFGFDTGRHMEFCDLMAERCSCLVVCPDFFRGVAPQWDAPFAHNFGFVQRLPRLLVCVQKTKWPMVREAFDGTKAFLEARGVKKAAGLAFCWGAYALWRACGEEDLAPGFIVCGASCHPSVHNVPGFNGDTLTPTQIVENIRCPQLVICSKDEPKDWWPGGTVEAALAKKSEAAGSSFQVYQERRHGFVNRGDPAEEEVERDSKACLEAAAQFMMARLQA